MILSVSRRTDIPNYYADWFFNRLRDGYAYVRNPVNDRQLSRIELSPEVVDCVVFWTKNPAAMLERLDELRDYNFYFQFTLTSYGKDMEPNLPDKRGELMATFKALSEKIGRDRVIWRYDPILLTPRYTADYHLKAFAEIATGLSGHTSRVVISFLDFYTKIRRNMALLQVEQLSREGMTELAGEMAAIAGKYQLTIESCAEQIDLESAGVKHGSCIDRELIEQIIGCKLKVKKDKNQRPACGCCESVDIGAYHTCLNGCKYCYANADDHTVKERVKSYGANSPVLCGSIRLNDHVTRPKAKSLKEI